MEVPDVFLERARRRGIFVFKIPGRRLQQAFGILYWWPTARSVSL
jgi:hypothetical protein